MLRPPPKRPELAEGPIVIEPEYTADGRRRRFLKRRVWLPLKDGSGWYSPPRFIPEWVPRVAYFLYVAGLLLAVAAVALVGVQQAR